MLTLCCVPSAWSHARHEAGIVTHLLALTMKRITVGKRDHRGDTRKLPKRFLGCWMEPGNLDVTKCSFWSENLSHKPSVSAQKWKFCHPQGKESDAFPSVPTGGSLALRLNHLVPSLPTPPLQAALLGKLLGPRPTLSGFVDVLKKGSDQTNGSQNTSSKC